MLVATHLLEDNLHPVPAPALAGAGRLTVLLPAANTGLEENSDILRMSVGDTQEEYMFASLSNFVNLWKLQKVARLTFECGEGTVKVSYCYGPGHPDRQMKEEKKRKSSAKISRGNERAAAHQAETLAEIKINNSKLKNKITLQDDEISALKRELSSSEKLLELRTERLVDLTNINISLKEEADNTSAELEKALATLAEREAARDQLSRQASVEEEQLNLDTANWELGNTRQELDIDNETNSDSFETLRAPP